MPLSERSPKPPARARSRRALKRVLLARKLGAAVLVGLAAWLSLHVLGIGMAGEGMVTVLVAARDLPAGYTIAVSDTTARRVPPTAVSESVREVDAETLKSGRILTGPIRNGEMLSSSRLRPVDTFDDLAPDRRAVHVPLRDNGTVSLLHRGSRVDLHSTADGKLVVGDVEVLTVDAAPSAGGGLGAVSSNDTPGVVIAVPLSSASAVMSALGAQGSEGGQIHLALRSR